MRSGNPGLPSRSYLLKAWKVSENGKAEWKAMLVSVETEQTHTIPILDHKSGLVISFTPTPGKFSGRRFTGTRSASDLP
jgi:hypothetical protein